MKVPSLIEEATDLFDLPIKAHGDTVVTLADVAKVRRTFKDRSVYARVNGAEGHLVERHPKGRTPMW